MTKAYNVFVLLNMTFCSLLDVYSENGFIFQKCNFTRWPSLFLHNWFGSFGILFTGAKIHLEKSFFCFCVFFFFLLFTRFIWWIKQKARNHANSSRWRRKVKELRRKQPTIKTTPVLLLMTVTVQAPAVQFNWKWLAGLFFAFFTLFSSSSSFFDVSSLYLDSKGFASCGMCLTCCWWTHSNRPIE